VDPELDWATDPELDPDPALVPELDPEFGAGPELDPEPESGPEPLHGPLGAGAEQPSVIMDNTIHARSVPRCCAVGFPVIPSLQ
jgi:hypothetical protein